MFYIWPLGLLVFNTMSGQSCHCLCPMHREDGMFCLGADAAEIEQVPVIGILGLVDVPMCAPCTSWWRVRCPERIGIRADGQP